MLAERYFKCSEEKPPQTIASPLIDWKNRNITTYPYLGYGAVCAIGGGRGSTIDHLIPQVACDTYPALADLKNEPVNKAILCDEHHRWIDWGVGADQDEEAKIKSFYEKGLEGVVESIITYPYPLEDDLIWIQFNQHTDLLTRMRVRMRRVISDLSQNLNQLPEGEYFEFDGVRYETSRKRLQDKIVTAQRAKVLINRSLAHWGRGNFGTPVPLAA